MHRLPKANSDYILIAIFPTNTCIWAQQVSSFELRIYSGPNMCLAANQVGFAIFKIVVATTVRAYGLRLIS